MDVTIGDGLAEALTGVDCVIDRATGPSPEQDAATEFFTAAARRGRRAGRSPRRGDPLKIEGVSDPLDGELYESGALLPGPHAVLAGPTFEQWLDAAS